LNKHAPVRTKICVVRRHAPWYNNEIALAKRARRSAERRLKSRREKDCALQVDVDILNLRREHVNALLEKAKAEHLNQEIGDCGTDQKKLYRIVDRMLSRNKSTKLPCHESLEGMLNIFGSHFSQKIENIRKGLGPTVDSGGSSETVFSAELFTSFSPVSASDIAAFVAACPTKTCSLDPIPTALLKKVMPTLSSSMAKMINCSLVHGSFPKQMKTALVTPVLKKPSLDPERFDNYRPISNTPFPAKLTERVAVSQLSDHLGENDLFVPVQSAYRRHHSTETVLVKLFDDLLLALDEGKAAMLVFLDLSIIIIITSGAGSRASAEQFVGEFVDS